LVEGYTSHAGEGFYNFNLGLDSAKHVRDLLKGIIGIVENDSIARIEVNSLGVSKESKRYVKITVVANN